MNRIISLILLLLVSIGVANAQNDNGESKYETAEQEYKSGSFNLAKETLKNSISTFKGKYKESAYRLMALCALEEGKLDEAKTYVTQLLKANPYYSTRLDDPQRLIDIIDERKQQGTSITTASQQAETIEETPVPVTVINEEMLHNIGARTLKEALIAYVPGMTDVATNDEMNVAMRGVYSSNQEKILILLNGHRLNSYSTNAATPDFSMSLEKVKQIEVLRGPASSIYGGVALTGVVNIITKDGNDVDGFKVKASAGNYGQIKGDLLFGKQFMDLNVLAWASIYNATGEKVYSDASEQKYAIIPVTGDIIVGGYNKQPTYDLGINLKYKNFGFMFNRRFAKTVAPMALSLAFAPYSYNRFRNINGNKPGNAVTSQIAELSYQAQKNKFSWMAKAFFDSQSQQRYQVAGDTIPDFGDLTTITPYMTDTAIRTTNGGFQCVNWEEYTYGIKLQGSYDYSLSKSHHGTILLGGEYNHFTLHDASYLEGINYNLILKTYNDEKVLLTGKETNADAFLQIKHNLGSKCIINAGVRYDYKNRREGKIINEFSPRVAFIYNLPKLNMKLSYSKAFVDAPYYYRSNTLDVQYGDEHLIPEKLTSLQLSFLSNKKLVDFLTLDANFCYNRATNFIVTDEATTQNVNAGKLSTFSFEFVSRFDIKKFMTELNFTYLRVLNSENYSVDGKKPYNVPQFQANLIAEYKILSNLSIHANANFITKQSCIFSDAYGTYSEYITIPSRCIINAGASYGFKYIELGVNVNNLLGTKYTQSGSTTAPIVQQGRWILGSIAYKF